MVRREPPSRSCAAHRGSRLRRRQSAQRVARARARRPRRPTSRATRGRARADGVVLPGVGAFAMRPGSSPRTGSTRRCARRSNRGRPYLGLCLGLQLLFDESDEHGATPGLGLLAGRVERFPAPGEPRRSAARAAHRLERGALPGRSRADAAAARARLLLLRARLSRGAARRRDRGGRGRLRRRRSRPRSRPRTSSPCSSTRRRARRPGAACSKRSAMDHVVRASSRSRACRAAGALACAGPIVQDAVHEVDPKALARIAVVPFLPLARFPRQRGVGCARRAAARPPTRPRSCRASRATRSRRRGSTWSPRATSRTRSRPGASPCRTATSSRSRRPRAREFGATSILVGTVYRYRERRGGGSGDAPRERRHRARALRGAGAADALDRRLRSHAAGAVRECVRCAALPGRGLALALGRGARALGPRRSGEDAGRAAMNAARVRADPRDRPARRSLRAARAGRYDAATVYDADPAAVARALRRARACPRLHVVDLDGARAGGPCNGAAVRAIVARARRLPSQVGGGIRDLARGRGRARARRRRASCSAPRRCATPALVREARARASRAAIAVGLDARDGRVAVEGWLDDAARSPRSRSARRVEDAGVGGAALHRHRARRHAARARTSRRPPRSRAPSSIPVIASGGVGSARRPARGCARRERGVAGVDRRARALHRRGRPRRRALRRRASRVMLCKRIIPCLDVDRGRVVKGVQLRRATSTPAIPVEVARRYDAQGADEITLPRHHRAPRGAADPARRGRAHRRARVHAAHASAAACARSTTCATCSTPAPTRSRSRPRRSHDPDLVAARPRGADRQREPRGRDRREARAAGGAGWEVFTHGGRTPDRPRRRRVGRAHGRRSARARSCSPAWTATAPASGYDLALRARGRRRASRSR